MATDFRHPDDWAAATALRGAVSLAVGATALSGLPAALADVAAAHFGPLAGVMVWLAILVGCIAAGGWAIRGLLGR